MYICLHIYIIRTWMVWTFDEYVVPELLHLCEVYVHHTCSGYVGPLDYVYSGGQLFGNQVGVANSNIWYTRISRLCHRAYCSNCVENGCSKLRQVFFFFTCNFRHCVYWVTYDNIQDLTFLVAVYNDSGSKKSTFQFSVWNSLYRLHCCKICTWSIRKIAINYYFGIANSE